MRIRAERDDLADVFGRANRGVGVRSALPILQGVLCEVTGSALKVMGTDLEMTVRTTTEVDVMEPGKVVVPGRLATEAIRKMPAGAVTISAEEGEVIIEGAGPRFTLREMAVDDFPSLNEPDLTGGLEVDGDQLLEAIGQVAIAASNDAARPILTGVLIEEVEGGVRMVATDSYRLAIRDVSGVNLTNQGLIPARGMRELGRAIGAEKVTMNIGEREAAFSTDRGSMVLRLIEGTFPNYRQLLPESYPNSVTVDREGLLEALGRASLVAEEHIPVRLTLIDGGVELTVTRQDVGGEAEHLAGDYSGSEESVAIAFNPRYLSEGVSAVQSDRIQIDVIDSLKPSVIRGVGHEEFTYLLMPVRI